MTRDELAARAMAGLVGTSKGEALMRAAWCWLACVACVVLAWFFGG